MAPVYSPGRTWLARELSDIVPSLAALPLLRTGGSVASLQGSDGWGYWALPAEDDKAYAVAYVFNTGEVWIIDAWLVRRPPYVELNEDSFTKTLDGCASFLDRLGCTKPYWWNVGMEGIQNRQLVTPDRFRRPFGQCLADIVEEEGIYKNNDKAVELLRRFFEKVFDQCGARRTLIR